MKYLYLFGAILLIVVIRMTVVGPEAVDEEQLPTVKATADTFAPSSTAPASSPGFAPFTGDEATVVTARDEQAFDPNRESRGTATPVPTTAVLEREALTVEPTVAVTTPAPVETPYVAPAPSGGNLESWLAASPWPQGLWRHVRCIVARESGGQPGVTGRAGERGLMQIHPVNVPFLARHGLAWEYMYDPATNLAAGYALYVSAGGFSPWRGGCW